MRSEFTKRTGIEVEPVKELLQHEEYPFMLANLDGICKTVDGTFIFEAKTASAFKAAELIAQYDAASEQIEKLTEQKKEAENLLKEMLGENESGLSDNRIVTWRSISQERLDSKTLKAEHPALYKKYTNKTSYRRFSIQSA